MEYILHIVIMLNIYIMLVLSANLPVGMARLLTLCQAAFYGIGAYISAFFLMQFNLPFIVVALLESKTRQHGKEQQDSRIEHEKHVQMHDGRRILPFIRADTHTVRSG